MITLERKYTVELTIAEGRLIENALHRYYKELKKERESDPEKFASGSGNALLLDKYRDMRNYFANWDNRSYMGDDV